MSKHKTTMKFSSTTLIAVLAILPSIAFAQPDGNEGAKVWAKAEAKIEEHLKGIDPKMRYAEFKSERLSKYLPEFRVFVAFELNTIGDKELFLVNQNAEITNLDASGSSDISQFLRTRKIKVETREDAIEFVKFFNELGSADWDISSLYNNTKGLTVFDKKFIQNFYGPESDWKHTSEKRQGGWKVKVTYAGDTLASIITPPIFEVDIDEDGKFRELREIDDFKFNR